MRRPAWSVACRRRRMSSRDGPSAASAMGAERLRCKVDVAKLDRAGLDGGDELVALAIDAGVADRTAGVVPDDEMRCGHRFFLPAHRTFTPVARQAAKMLAFTPKV